MKKTPYCVLSIRNLKDMLKVAEALQAKNGLTNTDADCFIYGLKKTGSQVSFESVRNVARPEHYDPFVVASSGLIPHRGGFNTYGK